SAVPRDRVTRANCRARSGDPPVADGSDVRSPTTGLLTSTTLGMRQVTIRDEGNRAVTKGPLRHAGIHSRRERKITVGIYDNERSRLPDPSWRGLRFRRLLLLIATFAFVPVAIAFDAL